MKALIVIDMQEAYFKSPNLARLANRLVEHINGLARDFDRNDDLIVNLRTVHLPDKSTWTRNMLEDGKGFAFKGDKETQNIAGLQLPAAVEIIKTRDSAFHGTHLLEVLREYAVDDITLAGVSAHSCIFHTAAAAYAYDFPVTLAQAAIGDEDGNLQHQAFDYLRREYRQTIE